MDQRQRFFCFQTKCTVDIADASTERFVIIEHIDSSEKTHTLNDLHATNTYKQFYRRTSDMCVVYVHCYCSRAHKQKYTNKKQRSAESWTETELLIHCSAVGNNEYTTEKNKNISTSQHNYSAARALTHRANGEKKRRKRKKLDCVNWK